MDEHALRTILEGGGGTAGLALRTALWLPGRLYGLGMRLRRAGYSRGWLASHPAAVPVISIGNITAGGSGKTPFTALLANHLVSLGKKPAILLRGYRATDGASDEAVLYQSLCPGVAVELGSDRTASALRAVAAGADALLMDDGFQHQRLRRDLDIVLVDATSPWGGGNTIPGGLLREAPAALAAAGAVIVTRSDQVEKDTLPPLLARIRRLAPQALVTTARHAPARLSSLGGASLALDCLRGRKVVTMSGIARPEAFEKTVETLGAEIAAQFRAADHRGFSPEKVKEAVAKAAESSGVVVTTEKDRAKIIIDAMTDNNVVDNNSVRESVWVLGIEQDVDRKADLLALVDTVVHGSGV